MKQILLVLILLGLLVGPAMAAETIKISDTATQAVKAGRVDSSRMSLRERRALGITVRNIRRVMDDTPDITPVGVLKVLMDENPKEYAAAAGEYGVDPEFWDNLIVFIERIMELIAMIMAMFS